MYKTLFILITLWIVFSQCVYAQDCGTIAPDKDISDKFRYRLKKMEKLDQGDVIVIPLTFTVIGNLTDQAYLSDDWITNTELPEINAGFLSVGIQFELHHIRRTEPITSRYTSFTQVANHMPAYEPDKCLNITYCHYNLSIAGQSKFPTWGIIKSGQDFNLVNISAAKSGRGTQIHEIGHNLNLRHTFEGGCVNDNCETQGDLVCDTPPCKGWGNCTDNDNGCNDGGTQLSNNFMAYSNCRDRYTTGQRVRMRATMHGVRAYLLEFNGEPLPAPTICNIVKPGNITVEVDQSYLFEVETDAQRVEAHHVVTSEENRTGITVMSGFSKYNKHGRPLEVDFTAFCYNGSTYKESQTIHVSVVNELPTPQGDPIREMFYIPSTGKIKILTEGGRTRYVQTTGE